MSAAVAGSSASCSKRISLLKTFTVQISMLGRQKRIYVLIYYPKMQVAHISPRDISHCRTYTWGHLYSWGTERGTGVMSTGKLECREPSHSFLVWRRIEWLGAVCASTAETYWRLETMIDITRKAILAKCSQQADEITIFFYQPVSLYPQSDVARHEIRTTGNTLRRSTSQMQHHSESKLKWRV